jgi:NAD(P)-dependent dehydrogenase (short-subunit alcohol dehydrogenase family)
VDLTDQATEPRIAAELARVAVGHTRLVLVHNAAVLERDDALSLSREHLRRVLELNLVVPAALNRLVRPHLTPGSSILYVGSTLSEKAVAGRASYVTTKHALVGLMRSTCQDLAGTGVHTVLVCPGFTDTEMLRIHTGNNTAVLDALKARSTLQRLISPEEIARLLVFCADNPVLHGAVVQASLGQVEQ